MVKTAKRQKHEQIIKKVRQNYKSLVWVEGGDNREVAVVDGLEVFRFSKDDSGIAVGRYEFDVLKLLQGRLTVDMPAPIELAIDCSYNVLSFLPGKVLSKKAVTELSFEKRRSLGVAIAGVINELNSKINQEELLAIPTSRPFARNRDEFYAAVYHFAQQQKTKYAVAYCHNYDQMRALRPDGSSSNIIVFGDFSSPNLVLSDHDELSGVIDWTELGLGDIHNELRPVFSVIGQSAFEQMIKALDPQLGTVDQEIVRLSAVIHELSVIVHGKQKGILSAERAKLATDSLDIWLPKDWATQWQTPVR